MLCNGTTKLGQPCCASAVAGSDKCMWHDPEARARTKVTADDVSDLFAGLDELLGVEPDHDQTPVWELEHEAIREVARLMFACGSRLGADSALGARFADHAERALLALHHEADAS